MKATLLETAQQAADAGPGIYAVHSGSGAYFPVMAMLEAGYAVFRGEVYDDRGRMVTVEVTTAPHPSMRVREGERRTITIGAQFFITCSRSATYLADQAGGVKRYRRTGSTAAAKEHRRSSAYDQEDVTKLSCAPATTGAGWTRRDDPVDKFLVLGGDD